jgi:hypothetical protein
VQLRRGLRAARQQERAQRRQVGVDLVAALLQPGGLLGLDPQALARLFALGHGQIGPEIEEVVLHPAQPGDVLAGQPSACNVTPRWEFSSSTSP